MATTSVSAARHKSQRRPRFLPIARWLSAFAMVLSATLLLMTMGGCADDEAAQLAQDQQASQAAADYTNALAYYHGDGVQQNYATALDLMNKSASEGDADATAWLNGRVGNGQPFWLLTVANQSPSTCEIWVDGKGTTSITAGKTITIPFLPGTTHSVDATWTTTHTVGPPVDSLGSLWLRHQQTVDHTTTPQSFTMNSNMTDYITANPIPQ